MHTVISAHLKSFAENHSLEYDLAHCCYSLWVPPHFHKAIDIRLTDDGYISVKLPSVHIQERVIIPYFITDVISEVTDFLADAVHRSLRG